MAILALAPAGVSAPIAPITAGSMQLAGGIPAAAQAAMPSGQLAATFQQAFAGAIGQTNDLQTAAKDIQKRLIVGEDIQLHDVMIAAEKGKLAFELTLQIRNKMVEAYQETMRMQI